MAVEGDLVVQLNRDFWSYASMLLGENDRRDLEEACRKVGIAVARSGPALPVSAADFCSVLRAARVEEGEAFVHHAGYMAGGNAARRVEANLPNPNAGAMRLVRAAASSWTNLVIEGRTPAPTRFELVIASGSTLERGWTAYAHGFLKGAATRLNEGAPPSIKEVNADGGRRWSATVDWAAPARAFTGGAAREGRKPRR